MMWLIPQGDDGSEHQRVDRFVDLRLGGDDDGQSPDRQYDQQDARPATLRISVSRFIRYLH